jgi:uroporphyrinogen-III synthase
VSDSPHDRSPAASSTPGRPLAGRRVAHFRAATQARELSDAIRSLGGDAVAVPLVAVVEPADDGSALRRALGRARAYDWLVVTSANGARAIADLARTAPGERVWALAAVGSATARTLHELGFAVDFVPSVATGTTLAAELPGRGDNRVLAPLAELAGPELEQGLVGRGFTVDRVDAYRLVDVEPQVDDRLALRHADALVFTSPSIVERFQVCGLSPGRAAIVSIGPRTTRSLRVAGLVPVHEASPHDVDGIVRALVAVLDRPATS